MNTTDPEFWEDLILAVEEGQVVPIVGRDLLQVDVDGESCLLHHVVAERLAADLKVPTVNLPDGYDANDVICAYEGFHGDPMAVSPRILRILKNLKVAVPEPLALLAEIPAFHLFISTSFDTLLEEAITKKRGRPPAVVAFPPASNLTDFDDSLIAQNGSVVFQILGRASASASFAVTEGQLLEQMHEFMSGVRRPQKLIARLQESHLLLLGVDFPDWLSRFLIRLARIKPLWDSRPMMEIIADTPKSGDGLAGFVRRFSPQQSRVFAGGSPFDLVRELHRRWFEKHPAATSGTQAIAASTSGDRPDDMASGSVFISYAHEDRGAAVRLADDLNTAGLEVWVDRRLNPGNDYRAIIERYIRDCAAFVPLISRNTQTEDERWFRKEWAQACDRARAYFGTDRSLIFPVAIDDTPNNQLNELRREIFGRSAVRAPGGQPPSALVEQLDLAQKAWRRQNQRV
jgi:hypothetical protein